MPARMVVELPTGKKVLFGGSGRDAGLADVALADDLTTVAGDKFKSALGTLADLVSILEESVNRIARKPDKIEMEFGAKLSSECNLWVVSGEGEAEFKVKLAWEKAGS
jgi:hypothetical protein